MRFRLGMAPQGGNGAQALQGGIGNAFMALGMAPYYEQQAREEGQAAALRRDQLASSIDTNRARSALYGEQAAAKRDELQRGSPGALLSTAALMNKVPLHQVPEFTQFATSGELPGQYVQPPADLGGGPALPKPAYADAERLGGDIMRTLGLLQGGLTAGGNIEQVAKAGGELQQQDIVQGAVDAAQSGDDMAMNRLNAVRGKREFSPFKAVGTTGTALNEVTGVGSVFDRGADVIFKKEGQSRINENNAQAGASNASAAKTRMEMQQGRRSGQTQVVTDAEGNITIVDKSTGLARPAVGLDGKPVKKGGPGGGPTKMPGEVQRMAIAMEALEKGLDSYEQMLTTFDPRSTDQASPEQRAAIKSLMADIQMQFKEAQALGALTGPDMEILAKALTDPATMSGMGYGRKGLNAQLKQAREGVSRRRMAIANQFNRPDFAPGAAAGDGQADPLGLRR